MARQKMRLVRRIPADVDIALRIEAAKKDISVNDLILKILLIPPLVWLSFSDYYGTLNRFSD
jgi:hypothetical protein